SAGGLWSGTVVPMVRQVGALVGVRALWGGRAPGAGDRSASDRGGTWAGLPASPDPVLCGRLGLAHSRAGAGNRGGDPGGGASCPGRVRRSTADGCLGDAWAGRPANCGGVAAPVAERVRAGTDGRRRGRGARPRRCRTSGGAGRGQVGPGRVRGARTRGPP